MTKGCFRGLVQGVWKKGVGGVIKKSFFQKDKCLCNRGEEKNFGGSRRGGKTCSRMGVVGKRGVLRKSNRQNRGTCARGGAESWSGGVSKKPPVGQKKTPGATRATKRTRKRILLGRGKVKRNSRG